jgi:hypothetical protein
MLASSFGCPDIAKDELPEVALLLSLIMHRNEGNHWACNYES